MTRCKKGDIAIVIRCNNDPSQVGRVVECKELVFHPFYDLLGWVVNDEDLVFADEVLRPIRDNDGRDETLSWKDVPKEVMA